MECSTLAVREGKPFAPKKFSDFRLYPCVPKAVNSLRKLGFELVVVTNQPDIANKPKILPSVVKLMHDELKKKLVSNILKFVHIVNLMIVYESQNQACWLRLL